MYTGRDRRDCIRAVVSPIKVDLPKKITRPFRADEVSGSVLLNARSGRVYEAIQVGSEISRITPFPTGSPARRS